MSQGTVVAARRAAWIQSKGQLLTVTRRAAATGGAATTRTIYFLPQPLGKDEAQDLQVEGNINAANSNPYRFICAGDSDVQEATDTIAYDGNTYQIVNVNPHVRQGVEIAMHCIGVRVTGF